jgi:tRNA modification GTPase
VTIDYAEEDLPPTVYEEIRRQLDDLNEKLRRLLESSLRRKGMIEGFNIAIVGKPNVGKSSLLNALLSFERAIVSDIAGTTRDTIEEQVRIGTHVVRLIDTAGIRKADDTIERIGIERSLASIERADIVIALFDASRPFDEEDAHILEVIERYRQEGKTILAAVNKSDLPQKFESDKISLFDPIFVSAKNGFDTLTRKLETILDTLARGDSLMLVSSRQIEAVERALKEMDAAYEPFESGELEFFAYHIQQAAKAIGSISEPYDNEAVLDAMFGEFCLGK